MDRAHRAAAIERFVKRVVERLVERPVERRQHEHQ
jgi:hypothetical protein